MANDRNYGSFGDYDRDRPDYGRDYGSNRDQGYRPTSDFGQRDDRNFRGGGTGYGRSDFGGERGRETYGAGNRDYYGGSGGAGRDGYGYQGGADRQRQSYGQYQGGYQGGRDQHNDRGNGDRGRPPQGYDYDDRGFIARAGDELRSWFGDEEAERRREYDQRYDERYGAQSAASTAYGRDSDYHSWRRGQIEALDRDYHEYRQENAKKFESEFGTWRSSRQTQRQSLGQVKEHMDVVGSDGGHVGTVDKVRGDRIILTKSDSDAGGRHHSIPSSWIQTVDDKVTIAKTADDAHKHWRDEETSGALFGDEGREKSGRVDLNRSFSGTY